MTPVAEDLERTQLLTELRGLLGTVPDSFALPADPKTGDSALAARCRASFKDFVLTFWSEVPGAAGQQLVWNWHLDLLCEQLQEVAERVFKGLPRLHDTLVNISPGTTKSTICSILFNAWVWTRMPHARVLTASHTDSLVLDLANKTRAVVKSELYGELFPEIELRSDQDTKSYFANTHGGDRYTCTVAGKSPMGFHAHFIVVDDPIDPKKAVSDVELDSAKDFMSNVIPTRKVDKRVTVTFLIMQRLHHRDPSAVMLDNARKPGAVKVRHVCLPAELYPKAGDDGAVAYDSSNVRPQHLAGRYVDGLMDPARLGKDTLAEYKASLGPYGYAGQFLQQPFPPGGGMFKAPYFALREKAAPYDCKRVRYWDRACLHGKTLIETSEGPKRIDKVRAGDLVLTRKGHRKVLRAWRTKFVDEAELRVVTFANGSSLCGTADHRVWTENRGWVELAEVTGGDHNLCFTPGVESWVNADQNGEKTPKSCCSRESSTPAGQASDISKPCGGAPPESGPSRTPCTGPCGVPLTVTSPKGLTFITRTRTGTTTTFRILSASPDESTTDVTIPWPPGTDPQPPTSRDGRTLASAGRTPHTATTCVASAERPLNLDESTPRLNTAPSAVVIDAGSGRGVPVYDLEVEGEHEFFANGVLVHNSTQDGGAYTAGVLQARVPDRSKHYVEHVVHGQWEPDERDRVIIATARRDRLKYGPKYEPTIVIEQEPGSAGVEAYRNIARRLAALGFSVKADRPTGKKDTRAEPWSCMCAAMGVVLVEDGTWDLDGYVQEHLLFRPEEGKRLGKYKDQVDASSGGFNYLSGGKSIQGRVYAFRKKTARGPFFLVLSEEDVGGVEIDPNTPAVLVWVEDGPVVEIPDLPFKAVASCGLGFWDAEPADLQKVWEQEVAPGRKPQDVVMTRDHGRKAWACMLRRYDQPVVLYVFYSTGGSRALSLALAACDALGRPRAAVHRPSQSDTSMEGVEPPSRHAYDVMRAARAAVVT